jgi:hypothetical protein
MVRIRRFGIVHTANMVAALYAFIALIFAAFFALFGALGVAIAPRGSEVSSQLGAGIVGILIVAVLLVVFYAVVGWVFTAVACAIYNVVAGWFGGIEVQIESSTPVGPAGGYPAYGYPAPYPARYPAPGGYPAPAQPGTPPAPWGGGTTPPPAPGR